MRCTKLLSALFILAGLCGLLSTPANSQRAATNHPITTIAVEIPSYGIIFLKAEINNSPPLWFALDSGARFPFALNTSRVLSMGYNLTNGPDGVGGAGEGTYQTKFARNVSVSIEGLTLPRQPYATTLSLGPIESLAGRHIDGLVGAHLFNRYVVEIDYVANTVKLYASRRFRYSGAGEILPASIENDYFFVKGTLAVSPTHEIPAKFLIDTGGGMIMAALTTPFVEVNNLVSSLGKTIRDNSLSALGGDVKVFVARARAIKLGTLTINEPIVHLSQNKSGALAATDFDGIIGAELLKKFRVIFDYSRQRLILEPNTYFSQRCEYNMTGVSVRATGQDFKRFTVYQVINDSPGAEAGVRVGDVIVSLNGRPASELTVDDFYRMFRQNHEILRVQLSRGISTVSAEIKPRRLL